MRNIKLTSQYDGTNFCGYEIQPGKRTVRGELEKALKKLYRSSVKFYSASRTDAGVHALGNVISFNAPASIPISRVPIALNSVLLDDVRVISAEKARTGFNARFDAKAKTYEYLIYNGEIMPPHLRKIAWQVKPKLNLAAMRKAARCLIGKHDFSSFCAAGGDDKNFVRIIHSFGIRYSSFVIWDGQKIKVVSIKVKGNGFLYKMVRNLAGTLVEVGLGRKKPDDIKRILKAKDRRLAGKTAPAQGLCLVKVNY